MQYIEPYLSMYIVHSIYTYTILQTSSTPSDSRCFIKNKQISIQEIIT